MFNSRSSRSQIDELLNWKIAPAASKPEATLNSSVASTRLPDFLVPSSDAALPPASTHPTFPLSGTPSVISLTHSVTARENGWVPIARDGIPDLCDFHLWPELILKNAILVPGLAEFFGTICDAELSRNQALPDLDDRHEYSSVSRAMGHSLREAFQATLNSAHDVQQFSEYREIIAAGAASAFLSRSPNAWKTAPFISWHRNTSRRDGSVQSHMHIEQPHLDELGGTRARLCTSLETAVEQSCTPFQVYHFTRPGFLSDELVAALESLFSTNEPIPWTLCDYPKNNCPSSLASLCGEHFSAHGVPISVGRNARPDSVDVSHIIDSVNWARTVANISVKKRALSKLSKSPTWKRSQSVAAALRKTIWMKLVAIDGTYAILGDGNHEYIFMRHRKSQTLAMSTCLDVTRSPNNNKNAPHMKVRIGMNIAATLDVAARGSLLARAEHVPVDLQIYPAMIDGSANDIYCAPSAQLSWEEVPELFGSMSSDSDRDPAAALTIRVQKHLPMLEDGPSIQFRMGRVDRSPFDDFHEARAWLRSCSGSHEWLPTRAQVAVGDVGGNKLRREYEIRRHIFSITDSAILPDVYGVFGNFRSPNSVHVLFLQEIGIPLRQYFRYANAGAVRIQRESLVEAMRTALRALHNSGYTHGAINTTSDLLVSAKPDGSIRIMFKNLSDIQWWWRKVPLGNVYALNHETSVQIDWSRMEHLIGFL